MAAASIALAAYSGTSSTETITPVTGIVVRAESVTAGKGCGRSATQVFKYAVLVGKLDTTSPESFKPENRITENVFDCFADGTFVELTADADGYGQYAVLVYAFNEAAWRAAGGDVAQRFGEGLGEAQLDGTARHAGVPEDPADGGLHGPGVAPGDLEPVGHVVGLRSVRRRRSGGSVRRTGRGGWCGCSTGRRSPGRHR